MLAPNKQNLILAKSQKKLFQNGYKLLKEKRTGLIVKFIEMLDQGKVLEIELKKEISLVLKNYQSQISLTNLLEFEHALNYIPSHDITISQKKISGVWLKNIQINLKSPFRSEIKNNLNSVLAIFGGYLPKILKLTQLKINCQLFASEIHKTNRQISNLERKIETKEKEIKFIKDALMQKESLERATLIKIFNN